jgi:Uma2 family endonuclease
VTLAFGNRQSPIVTPYRWTIARYHKAVEAGIFEGQPLELLDGDLIEISPEGVPHAGISSNAADYLQEMLGSQVKVREAKPITLPNDSEPEPDIAIVKPLGNLYKTDRHPKVDDIFWVIEYANISLEKDLQFKDKIYAQAGIVEYWVVNLKTQALVVFRNPMDGEYQSQETMASGTVSAKSFPAVQLRVERLIQ